MTQNLRRERTVCAAEAVRRHMIIRIVALTVAGGKNLPADPFSALQKDRTDTASGGSNRRHHTGGSTANDYQFFCHLVTFAFDLIV